MGRLVGFGVVVFFLAGGFVWFEKWRESVVWCPYVVCVCVSGVCPVC